MKTIDHEELREIVRSVYLANGVSEEVARTVSDLQVEANVVGHDSHGVSNTEKYVNEIHLGHIVPDSRLEVLQEGPSTLVLDGNWGFGYSITSEAIPLIAAKAKQNGVCAAIIRGRDTSAGSAPTPPCSRSSR